MNKHALFTNIPTIITENIPGSWRREGNCITLQQYRYHFYVSKVINVA